MESHEYSIPGSVMGMYTTTPIGGGTVIGYYYGTLTDENMSIVISDRPIVYVEGSLEQHVKYFAFWVLRLKQNIGYD